MAMNPDLTKTFESVMNSLPDKTQGMQEIKVIKNEFMTQGIGILMLHPIDYEVFSKQNINEVATDKDNEYEGDNDY